MRLKLLVVILSCIIISSCEDVYDKEMRYEKEINLRFNKSLPEELKEKLAAVTSEEGKYNKSEVSSNFNISGNICVVKNQFDEKYNEVLGIDHMLIKEFLKNGYRVSFNLENLQYIIITDIELEKVGEYINDKGVRSQDAMVTYDFIYVYDIANDELHFVTSHKGGDPDKIITETNQKPAMPFGQSWDSEDYFSYLYTNGYLSKSANKQKKAFYSKDYVDVLESSNFLF